MTDQTSRARLLAAALLLCAGCTGDDEGRAAAASLPQPCQAPQVVADLPKSIREASGVAPSRTHADLLWVLSDSDPYLYAVDTLGRERGKVRVPGEVGDWEDLALAPCGDRDCIYIADIGDNQHARRDVAILRVPEPAPTDETTAAPERFPFAYPDGPRDSESLIVLPGERLLVVSKGRNGPVALYRFPQLIANTAVQLEQVRAYTPGLVQMPDMITGAAASPNGKWVAIRSYTYVDLYAATESGIAETRTARVSLAPLGERQGEGVTITDAGELFFVGERAMGSPGPLSRMRCTLP